MIEQMPPDTHLDDRVCPRVGEALAEAGNGSAQYNIGLMHFYGQNVRKDAVEAYKWFLLAGKHGIEKGKVAMDRMSYRMSPLQISEAVSRAEEWQKSKTN